MLSLIFCAYAPIYLISMIDSNPQHGWLKYLTKPRDMSEWFVDIIHKNNLECKWFGGRNVKILCDFGNFVCLILS